MGEGEDEVEGKDECEGGLRLRLGLLPELWNAAATTPVLACCGGQPSGV